MGKRKYNGNISSDERGLVSFLVVTIIMVIATLIVMSYARVVQREQVQTTDRQLNIQALYAAESAVNDAMNAIKNNPTLADHDYNDCDDFTTTAGLNSDLGDNAAYSCLLVDTSPTRLEYDGINTNDSTVIPLRAKDGGTVDRVEISWDSDSPGDPNPLAGCYTATTSLPVIWPPNCKVGMIRFELLPFSSSMTREDIITRQAVGFLVPYRTGGSNVGGINVFRQTPNASLNKGEVAGVRCDDPSIGTRRCTYEIGGISSSLAYMRLKSIYRNTPVTVRLFRDGNPSPIETTGAQVEVDVTGRAGGIIKRIKVHRQIPTNSDYTAPEFALQSKNSLCKHFTFRPGVIAPQTSGDECDPRT